MSGKKLSFLEIAKLNKDKIVKKEEVVTETKKKEDTNYLYNDNMVYGYSDGIVEYFIDLNKKAGSSKSITNRVISNRLFERNFETNIKNKGFIKIGD